MVALVWCGVVWCGETRGGGMVVGALVVAVVWYGESGGIVLDILDKPSVRPTD